MRKIYCIYLVVLVQDKFTFGLNCMQIVLLRAMANKKVYTILLRLKLFG